MNEKWDRGFLGHPTGLAILFFTEMWERFSYYGMRALLVLYLSSTTGLGWTTKDALVLYGWYTMMVYVMSIPGGILADRVFGQKKMVIIGGFILVAGHLILAIDGQFWFFTGLALIVLGVGGLKPNISTMVGGLYKEGDARRDKGFTIFYIGINVGAFISSIVVGYIGETVGWHYGFAVAGVGMLLGQVVFIWGKKYLVGIGDFVKNNKQEISKTVSKGLTKEEKDRMLVLLLSFIIIIVFFGAFEQAGGLLNIYAKEKIDRVAFGFEIPASTFQSVNAFFIMVFGGAVATFWAFRKKKKKESSSLFKMGIGTIITGLGFIAMVFAAMEAGAEPFGKGAVYWLILAYLFHTLGELCVSPVALSFITKLAPLKYASLMMGVYFAATGLGNKVAGLIGEASQTEPIEVAFNAGMKAELKEYGENLSNIENDKPIKFKAELFIENDEVVIKEVEKKKNIKTFFEVKGATALKKIIEEQQKDGIKPLHSVIALSKDSEAAKVKENKGDGKTYEGSIRILELENSSEFNIFLIVAIFTIVLGIVVVLLLKPLKKLTHGVEDREE